GDAGLYGFARVAGRAWFEKSSWARFSTNVQRSERWFAERGSWILVFSRLMPGARLPTYLAAGFLRLPLNRFLLITGAASLLWTATALASPGPGSRRPAQLHPRCIRPPAGCETVRHTGLAQANPNSCHE